MKRTLTVLTVAVCGFGFLGCSSPEEKAVKMMEEMATISEKHQDDCDKMGEELGKLIDSNADLIKSLKDKKGSEEEEKALKEKYGARLEAASKKMMGGVMKCATNEKVGAAMKKM
ncbi:MAG: hypothetical protein H6704_05185 [Myxococcales bacterium]|jgi:ElaB/YqjD/DUF883 family membrane-anchored ribosome-binding protein|nr:hypothetical protein [Myxococcales bacterium]